MIYHYLTFCKEGLEITHTEMLPDGQVKVYFNTPMKTCRNSAVCWLPDNKWEDIQGYSQEDMGFIKKVLHNNADTIMEFARKETKDV